MKVALELKLEVDVPDELIGCDAGALKRWIWNEHSDVLLEATDVVSTPPSQPETSEIGVANPSPSLSPSSSNRRSVEHQLQMLDKLLSNVQRQYLQVEKSPVVFGFLLDSLLDLMDSEYGFIGEVKHDADGRMFLQTHAITNVAWNQETTAFYEYNLSHGLKFYKLDNLFGAVMTEKKVVISNSPANDPSARGVPKGHPPMKSFMGIPFLEHGTSNLVGMVGIANKPGGYSQEDVEFLEPFIVTCSNLIQIYNVIQENRRLINTLEEKVAERTRELSQANESLEAANRRVVAASAAQLNHFACMSHEIRTPLNCIIGLSSLLQEMGLSGKQKEALKMIITSGELLCTVVNDILSYSKLESGNVAVEIRRTNLQDTLDSVVNAFEHKARSKKLAFCLNYSPRVPEFIDTDGNRLQQILYNLLGNALKFSDEGGSVELSVDMIGSAKANKKDDKAPLAKSLSVCPPDKQNTAAKAGGLYILRFSVKDYGRGIARKDFDRIFEPFSQASGDTERLYGGTGLGLAITANLVARLGGTIGVESELGRWSKFTIEFPGAAMEELGIQDLVRRLDDTRIFFVGDPVDSCSRRVVDNLRVGVERFESLTELRETIAAESKVDQSRVRCCLFLVDEVLYNSDLYKAIIEESMQTIRTALVTYGQQYWVAESSAHFRSISELLPCVLLKTLVSLRERSDSPRLRALHKQRSESKLDVLQHVDILIAEDNLINQRVLCKMLERMGIDRVDIAHNGQEAVDMTSVKFYDVIFMDMQMPVMCGDVACRLIRESYQDGDRRPKIVFLSAHAYDIYETKALDSGADGYISKPFNIKKLGDFLRTLDVSPEC